MSASSGFAFDVAFEVVEDGLPALSLLLVRVRAFGIEGFAQRHAAIAVIDEVDVHLAAIIYPILQMLAGIDRDIGCLLYTSRCV